MLVEMLLLLCTTRWGRDYLRGNGVYEVVRALHENETVDKASAIFSVRFHTLTERR